MLQNVFNITILKVLNVVIGIKVELYIQEHSLLLPYVVVPLSFCVARFLGDAPNVLISLS
jgi:hypothetical protein